MKKFCFQLLLISLFLFLIIFPISNSINFHENDDWVYYRTVQNFLHGNYRLHDDIEATFYLQGAIGTVFALAFGISKLPILTLIFSVLNFFVFSLVIYRFYSTNKWLAVLLGLLFFVNPLHTYSIFGFMTENYFMFFFLVAIYFLKAYLEKFNKIDFALFNAAIVAGFFIRQFSVLLPVAFIFVLITKRKYIPALCQFIILVLLYGFYRKFIPETTVMSISNNTSIKGLLGFTFHFDFLLPLILYVPALLFPAIIPSFIEELKKSTTRKALITTILALLIFVLISLFFVSSKNVFNTIFYLGNTVQRAGFEYSPYLGIKPAFPAADNIYNAWDFLAKLSLGFLISLIFIKFKKSINVFSIFIVLYLFLLTTFAHIFDRYALLLIPSAVFLLFELNVITIKKYSLIIISAFIIIFGFYDYQFAMDFVSVNNYLWNDATKLAATYKIENSLISAGFPWLREFANSGRKKDGTFKHYKFFYSFQDHTDFDFETKLIYSHKIQFPLSIFNSTTIYTFSNPNLK